MKEPILLCEYTTRDLLRDAANMLHAHGFRNSVKLIRLQAKEIPNVPISGLVKVKVLRDETRKPLGRRKEKARG